VSSWQNWIWGPRKLRVVLKRRSQGYRIHFVTLVLNALMRYWMYARWHDCITLPYGRHILSVKLSDFTVWRHTWRKNWVNCSVLTGYNASLRTLISSLLSHRKLRSSLTESHSLLSLPADTTMASFQGNQPSKMMSIVWYILFQKPLLTAHFKLSFLRFG
jgi:hypothetical protein